MWPIRIIENLNHCSFFYLGHLTCFKIKHTIQNPYTSEHTLKSSAFPTPSSHCQQLMTNGEILISAATNRQTTLFRLCAAVNLLPPRLLQCIFPDANTEFAITSQLNS